jgi:uncharacterized membrane protein YgdD (TMEM256/DUF423 family)
VPLVNIGLREKKMKKVLFGVFGVVLAGLAAAQGENGVNLSEFSSWFTSPHALAAVVVGLVAVVRKHFFKLDGILVPAMALVLGVVLAFLGNLLGHVTGNWLLFGLQAGFEAVLAVTGVRAILQGLPQKGGEKGGDGTPPTVPPPKVK